MLLYHELLRVDELMAGPGFLIERKERKERGLRYIISCQRCIV